MQRAVHVRSIVACHTHSWFSLSTCLPPTPVRAYSCHPSSLPTIFLTLARAFWLPSAADYLRFLTTVHLAFYLTCVRWFMRSTTVSTFYKNTCRAMLHRRCCLYTHIHAATYSTIYFVLCTHTTVLLLGCIWFFRVTVVPSRAIPAGWFWFHFLLYAHTTTTCATWTLPPSYTFLPVVAVHTPLPAIPFGPPLILPTDIYMPPLQQHTPLVRSRNSYPQFGGSFLTQLQTTLVPHACRMTTPAALKAYHHGSITLLLLST